MMIRLFIFCIVCCCFTRAVPSPVINKNQDTLPTSQILVVLTNNWDSVQATLYAFEKVNGQWQQQFSHAVVVGAKGLGVGDGIVPLVIAGAPVKREGDLKAPAGIFKIGAAFGYAPAADAGFIKDNYIQAKDTVICVDDVSSIYYNRIISADTARKDWNSFEYMHRKDDYYKWGLFVGHNAPATIAGQGSCIFIHISESATIGTEGCTAMSEANLLKVLHWIDALKQPLLIQLPAGEYKALMQRYSLPLVQ